MSTRDMPEVSRRLANALVEAYPGHVRSRLGEHPVEGLEAAIAEGEAWLAEKLTELLSQPFDAQRRGPLEVFQEAMRFPTEHLVAAGAAPKPRDPTTESALPGDVYDLAPASSRDLGDELWAIHLAWGASKAAALTASPPPQSADGER